MGGLNVCFVLMVSVSSFLNECRLINKLTA